MAKFATSPDAQFAARAGFAKSVAPLGFLKSSGHPVSIVYRASDKRRAPNAGEIRRPLCKPALIPVLEVCRVPGCPETVFPEIALAKGPTIEDDPTAGQQVAGSHPDASARAAAAERQRLLDIMDLAAIIVRDFDGTIRMWSEGCRRIYGWSAEKAVGKACHDLLQTAFPVPFADIEAALLRDGLWVGELRQRTQDGREVTVAVRKVLHREADGGGLSVMENATDVTERQQLEDNLRHTTALLAAVGTCTPDPIYAKDVNGRFLFANRATLAIIGKPADDVIGRTDADFHDNPEQAAVVMANDRVLLKPAARRDLKRPSTRRVWESAYSGPRRRHCWRRTGV